MPALTIELCPETGICSIVKPDGKKIDLMPNEVKEVAAAQGNADAVRKALAEVDDGFARGLDAGELAQVASQLKS